MNDGIADYYRRKAEDTKIAWAALCGAKMTYQNYPTEPHRVALRKAQKAYDYAAYTGD